MLILVGEETLAIGDLALSNKYLALDWLMGLVIPILLSILL